MSDGMRQEAVYYFGFEALSCRKDIALKLEKFFSEIYFAIFFLQEFSTSEKVKTNQFSTKKINCLLAADSCCGLTRPHTELFAVLLSRVFVHKPVKLTT